MPTAATLGFGAEDEEPRDPDRLPDSGDPSGPCPRCGRVSHFTEVFTEPVTFTGGWWSSGAGHERAHDERLALLQCSGCEQRVIVVEERLVGGVRRGTQGMVTWRGFYWWPTPGAAQLDVSVPPEVAQAYDEAARCLAVGAAHGAVSVLRTAVAFIVHDKGSPEARAKKSLKEQVAQMVKDGGWPASLADWATHIRELGNAGAHPDVFGHVEVDEARDLQRLVAQLIEVIYVLPAKIGRARSSRMSRPS